ncbi:MAG: helix-turn-helix transcriptional regulator [Lachnospiraceae bacterium]|nr:helix-turn-helix transcriptional regulator [Lachnospiraceae bacterium]
MLGDQIKKLRCARLLSQVDLGRKVGVSKQCISNWENNNIMPSVDMLINLASFFGCSTDYILEMEEGPRYYLEVDSLNESQVQAILHVCEEFRKINDKAQSS